MLHVKKTYNIFLKMYGKVFFCYIYARVYEDGTTSFARRQPNMM